MIPVGKGTKKTNGIKIILLTNVLMPMALSELVKDLIIKFQPGCNMAANKIKKKIFDSLILIINFL